jgi:lipoyl-dependent peroxiredoxin
MALSPQLGKAGLTPENLEITATVTFENVGEHFAITNSPLDLRALLPGANQEPVDAAVKAAETGCTVSKFFKAEISVDARLEVTA